MLKIKKRYCFVAVLLAISMLLCSGCGTEANSNTGDSNIIMQAPAPKVPSTATEEDDFIDNQVMVIMQKHASHKKYNIFDFLKVGCVNVRTLTDDKDVEKGAHKAMILTLGLHSKKNVIKAIRALEQRDDVYVAEPAYEGTFPGKKVSNAPDDDRVIVDKKYFNDTIEQKFVDNSVGMIMQPYANLTEYTPEDFAYVGCVKINDLPNQGDVDDVGRYIFLTLDENSKENVLKVVSILLQREDVYSAFTDSILEPFLAESSTNDNIDSQWAISKTSLDDAWEVPVSSTAPVVTVGIIDDGIDVSHPAISPYVDRSLYWGDAPFSSTSEHGTVVAGAVLTAANKLSSTASNDWTLKLISLDVEIGGVRTIQNVSAVVKFAKQNNIDVLNCSAGQELYNDAVSKCEEAISQYSGVFVCAAGNSYHDNDNTPVYPSNFNLPNLISVGASNSSDARWYSSTTGNGSNWGVESVDIFAPGHEILTCYPYGMCEDGTHDTTNTIHDSTGYHKVNGTSISSPYVAGVAALMIAIHPKITAAQIKDNIKDAADYCSNLIDYCDSDGRLNAYQSVLANSHYNYIYINAIKHRGFCSCGNTKEEYHTYTASGTTRTCIYCGYQVQLQNVEPEHEIE